MKIIGRILKVIFWLVVVFVLWGGYWLFNNHVLAFARLSPTGDWGFWYYADRAEMLKNPYDGAVHWFRGWRAVPVDATDIAYEGVTSWEGAGPWETRLTCRTTKKAFEDMARVYGYHLATNTFVNVIAEEKGGMPNAPEAFVDVLPELWSFTMPKEYLTFTCLTRNYTGMIMLLDCRTGKLYARLINRMYRHKFDWSWLDAFPRCRELMDDGKGYLVLDKGYSR